MNVYIDRLGMPDNGIVFQQGLMQFWVPSKMQPNLPYNPRHLPVALDDRDPEWYYMEHEAMRLARELDAVVEENAYTHYLLSKLK